MMERLKTGNGVTSLLWLFPLVIVAMGCDGGLSITLDPGNGNSNCIQQDVIEEQCFLEEVVAEECYEDAYFVEVCDEIFPGVFDCYDELVVETVCEDVVIDVVEVCEDVVVDSILICA